MAGKRRCPVAEAQAGSRLAAAEEGRLHPVAEVGKAPSWFLTLIVEKVNSHTAS